MFKIVKVKTKQDHKWDLTVNGTTVGFAEAVYKTATQRTWSGEIHLPTAEGKMIDVEVSGLRSVKAVVDYIMDAVGTAEVNVAEKVVEKKVKSKLPAVLKKSMVTAENAIELSQHYGYSVMGKGKKVRSGAEQAKYLLKQLDSKAKTVAKVPMADLVDIAKGGETQVSSMTEHYADE